MSLSNSIYIEKDAILGNFEKYLKDEAPDKFNLGVGSYRDENLKPYVFESIKKSIEDVLKKGITYDEVNLNDNEVFNTFAQQFILGLDYEYHKNLLKKRDILTFQTVGGSGAYSLFIDFIKLYSPGIVLYSNPTWDFHREFCAVRNMPCYPYFYYDEETKKVNLKKLIESIDKYPDGTYIILQPLGHNPTGCDLTDEEWIELGHYIKKRNFFPILDFAYFGLVTGDIEYESTRIKTFIDLDIQFCICQTFSKNVGLYGERIGAFHLITQDKEESELLRPYFTRYLENTNNLPIKHGNILINNIAQNEDLKKLLKEEISFISNRIKTNRTFLFDNLKKEIDNRDFNSIIHQSGMFSIMNLDEKEVADLKKIYHYYLLNNGRINISGTNNVKSLQLIKFIKLLLKKK